MSGTNNEPNLVTVGASAVPPKSPANFIFPFAVVVASGIADNNVAGSLTTLFTNAVVATAVLLSVEVMVAATTLLPKVTNPVNVGDAIGAFKLSAFCVNVEIGLLISETLSTLFNPKLALAFVALAAPVPPFKISTIPVTFVAVPVNVPEKLPTTELAVILVALTFPEKVLAVITLPSKLPLPSRSTKALIKF